MSRQREPMRREREMRCPLSAQNGQSQVKVRPALLCVSSHAHRGGGGHVQHQHLVVPERLNLFRCFTVSGHHLLHQVDLDGNGVVNLREIALPCNHLAGEVVGGGDGQVEEGGHAAQAAGCMVSRPAALHAADDSFDGLPN